MSANQRQNTETLPTRAGRRHAVAVFAMAMAIAIAIAIPTAPAIAVPIMKVLELSREGALVTYRVDRNGFGKAIVYLCDSCSETIELEITPQTRLEVNGKEASFRQHSRARRSRMTVFYLPDERRLTRIVASFR